MINRTSKRNSEPWARWIAPCVAKGALHLAHGGVVGTIENLGVVQEGASPSWSGKKFSK